MEEKTYLRVQWFLEEPDNYQPEYIDEFLDIQLVFPEFPPETYELSIRIFSDNLFLQGVSSRYLGGKGPRRINFQVPVFFYNRESPLYIFVYRNSYPIWFGKINDVYYHFTRVDLEDLDPSSEKWFFAAYMMKCSAWDEFCQKNFNRSVLLKLVRLLHRRYLQTDSERFLAVSGKKEEARYFAEKILGAYLNDDSYYTAPIAELSIDDLISGEVRWKQVAAKLEKSMPKVVLIAFPEPNYRLDKLQAIKRQINRLRIFFPGIHTTFIFYGHPDFQLFLQECCSEGKALFAEEACIDLNDQSNEEFMWD